MTFTCDKSVLMDAINTVSRAVASKSPVPALEGILIEATIGTVTLTAYDLKRGIYTSIDAEVTEPGRIVLTARLFSDIIRNLPTGTVSISKQTGETASISCGNSSYNIATTNPDDYPDLPKIDKPSNLTLPQNMLADMIRQTIFATSSDESKPVYTGELFDFQTNLFTIVALDGFRMAVRKERLEDPVEPCQFVVPGTSLGDLEKLCGDSTDPVTILLGDKHLSFSIGRTVLISRRIAGDFINYKKTIPDSFAVNVIANKLELQKSVERVSLIIDDKTKTPVLCSFSDNYIKLSCQTAIGHAEDICIVDGAGNDTDIAFNNRYFLDAIKACPSKEFRVSLNSKVSPCILTPTDNEDNYLYMVLPVRTRD